MTDGEPRVAADHIHEVDGNRLTLLPDGPGQRDALIALIAGARRSLRLLYYIFADDGSGRMVRDALVAARGRGVAVTLIIDGFGSDVDEDFMRPLTDAGGEVCRFHPRVGRRYLLRNHQKLALADGESDAPKVIVGGFNIEDSYFGTIADGAWRDIGLIVEGPAAGRLLRYFDELSDWVRRPRAPIRELRRQIRRWSDEDGHISWLLGGPTRRLSPWARAISNEMRTAKRMWMIAAYFAPGPLMLRRIERVGRRGDARIVTAAKSDNGATIGAARFTYGGLLKRGVRVFEYQPTKLHAKLFLIDDAVHIGSANFDMRSLYLNMELMLRVEDAGFARAIAAHFESEIAQSREINRDEVRGWRQLPRRMRWAASYFLVAVVDYTVSRRLNFGLDGSEL